MQKLYQPFVSKIEHAIGKIEASAQMGSTRTFSESLNRFTPDLVKAKLNDETVLETKTGLQTLASLLGKENVAKPFKGDHPDFSHLRTKKGVDYHYIVSMFIDVHSSTNFHRKYDLEQIALIIQTIVSAATQTIALFGGHIQRLQFDGVFCYFGGRKIKKEDAVKSAIDAAAFFTYFMKCELKEVFQIEGIEDIHTRIGIDFGDDHEVQWIIFGSEGCDELTTNSLHTSLAPKMQANAKRNGIMIGKNVRERLGKNEFFTDFIRDDKNNVNEALRYIYKDAQKSFYYSQYEFNWEPYLKETYWFFKQGADGTLIIDYTITRSDKLKEIQKLDSLYEKTIALETGNATLNTKGQILPNKSGITIPTNKFYYDSRLEK